ncbi:MAG: hypothetical protein ABI945_10885 [Nitrospirales bacterium]
MWKTTTSRLEPATHCEIQGCINDTTKADGERGLHGKRNSYSPPGNGPTTGMCLSGYYLCEEAIKLQHGERDP